MTIQDLQIKRHFRRLSLTSLAMTIAVSTMGCDDRPFDDENGLEEPTLTTAEELEPYEPAPLDSTGRVDDNVGYDPASGYDIGSGYADSDYDTAYGIESAYGESQAGTQPSLKSQSTGLDGNASQPTDGPKN